MKKQPKKAESLPTDFLDTVITDPMEAVAPYLAQAGVEQYEVNFFVYRKVDDGRKPDAFLFKCKPEDFDIAELGERYGGGMYRIRIYVKDEENPGGVIRGGGLIAVEKPPGFKPRSVPEQPAAPVAADGMTAFERIVMENMRQSNERFERIMEALAKREEPRDPLSTLEGIRAIAEMFKQPAPPPAAPASDFRSTLNAARDLLEISGGLGGGGGGDPESMVLGRGLGVIEKMIDRAASQQQTRGAAGQAAGASDGAPAVIVEQPAAPAATAATEQESETVLRFRLQMRSACRAAARGEDPEEYAEISFPFVPDADLKSISENPGWFAVIVQAVPEAAEHQAWFTKARDKLVALWKDSLPPLTDAPAGGTVAGGGNTPGA